MSQQTTEAVSVYNSDDEFVGYAILKSGTTKLASINLYTEEEKQQLDETVKRQNEEALLRANWPEQSDPDVQQVLTELPVEYQEREVIDEDASDIVWASVDPLTGTAVIDQENSTLVYKTLKVPAPDNAIQRLNEASKIVARRRAGLDAKD